MKDLQYQKFARTPAFPCSAEFVTRSQAAQSYFMSWFQCPSPQSFNVMLEEMHEIYLPGKGRLRNGPLSNNRASTNKTIAHMLGFKSLANGRVTLPGISSGYCPLVDRSRYHYATMDNRGRRIYQERLVEVLTQKPVNWILFGRMAACWHPWWKGNWGIFGLILNVLLAAEGMILEYQGYVDLLFQICSLESLEGLPSMIREGKLLYTPGLPDQAAYQRPMKAGWKDGKRIF